MKSLADIQNVTAAKPPRILVHAREGAGKSTLGANFPHPVSLDIEGGIPANVTVPSFGLLKSYSDVCSCIEPLGTEPHGYQTLVVDSLDAIEPLVWGAVCVANGWKTIESPGYGKGYVVTDRFWQDILRGLDWLRHERGMTILVLAHSAPELVNDPRTSPYTSYQLRLHRRARGLVMDWCDAIGFLSPDVIVREEGNGFRKHARAEGGNVRWLHWENRAAFVAKNRYGLPAKMACPINFDFAAQLEPFFPPAAAPGSGESSSRAAPNKRVNK